MNRKWWLFVDAILIGVILAHALPAFGQALPTVTPDTNWIAVGIAVVCVFLIAGGIWWLRDRPGAVAKAKEEVPPGVMAMFEKLIGQRTQTDTVTKIPGPYYDVPTTPAVAAPPAVALDPDKLAALEAARVAYENAKADAGIP